MNPCPSASRSCLWLTTHCPWIWHTQLLVQQYNSNTIKTQRTYELQRNAWHRNASIRRKENNIRHSNHNTASVDEVRQVEETSESIENTGQNVWHRNEHANRWTPSNKCARCLIQILIAAICRSIERTETIKLTLNKTTFIFQSWMCKAVKLYIQLRLIH